LPRERDRPELDILASAHASLFSVCSGGLENVLDAFLRPEPVLRPEPDGAALDHHLREIQVRTISMQHAMQQALKARGRGPYARGTAPADRACHWAWTAPV